MSSASKSYSLWLLPEKSLGEELQSVIMELSAHCHAPVFQPHVTLLGRIDAVPSAAVQAAERLAEQLSEFSLRARGIAHSHEYFRCLFIEVAADRPLLAAHGQACRLFGVRARNYRPHLSLLYGSLSLPRRRRLAEALVPPSNPLPMHSLALVNMAEDHEPKHWKICRKYRLPRAR